MSFLAFGFLLFDEAHVLAFMVLPGLVDAGHCCGGLSPSVAAIRRHAGVGSLHFFRRYLVPELEVYLEVSLLVLILVALS